MFTPVHTSRSAATVVRTVGSAGASQNTGDTRKAGFALGPLERCIVQHESGGERYAVNAGGDESFYQWSPTTWRYAERVARLSYSWLARDSDLERQTRVFRRYWAGHEGEWETASLCS
jgi:hypothetical protein